jgi:hypothetical protein
MDVSTLLKAYEQTRWESTGLLELARAASGEQVGTVEENECRLTHLWDWAFQVKGRLDCKMPDLGKIERVGWWNVVLDLRRID